MVSSDLDELFDISDRVVVMLSGGVGGRIRAAFRPRADRGDHDRGAPMTPHLHRRPASAALFIGARARSVRRHFPGRRLFRARDVPEHRRRRLPAAGRAAAEPALGAAPVHHRGRRFDLVPQRLFQHRRAGTVLCRGDLRGVHGDLAERLRRPVSCPRCVRRRHGRRRALGAVAGLLRLNSGTDEVITTLMGNFIAGLCSSM